MPGEYQQPPQTSRCSPQPLELPQPAGHPFQLRNLFYRQSDALMAVDVELTHGVRAGRPRLVFKGAYTGTGRDASFDVSPDGQWF